MNLINFIRRVYENGIPPRLNATNLNEDQRALQTVCDVADLETDAGRAITRAADAAAQRTALDVDSKAEVTAKADAAKSGAEATAAGALAGHVAAADPHAQYQKEEAGKGLSANDYDNTEKAKLAGIEAGAQVANAARLSTTASGEAEVTAAPAHWWVLVGGALKRLTYAAWQTLVRAEVAPAIEAGTATATPADTDIEASVNPTTHALQKTTWAQKKAAIATFLDRASTTVKGIVMLGASGGAAKLTKMPDGATAVYSNDAWTDLTGLTFNNCNHTEANGEITLTPTVGGGFMNYSNPLNAGKMLRLRAKRLTTSSAQFSIYFWNTGYTISQQILTTFSTKYQVIEVQIPMFCRYIEIRPESGGTTPIVICYMFIGDSGYLPGSASEEGIRVLDQLGDTAGVGVAASGTLTSDTTNVADGETFTAGGKTYTFKTTLGTTEGQVLIGADYQASLVNAARAVNYTGTPGTDYYCAAAHPLVSAVNTSAAVLTFTARSTGIIGNQITLAETSAHLSVSGSTLTGGIDDVGKKIITQIQNNIAASGTRPAAAMIERTDTSKVGYEATIKLALGATYTFPAGGTFDWVALAYDANIGGADQGTSSGGATVTMAGANSKMWIRRRS